MKQLTIVYLFVFSSILAAQNLVLNPSFETQKTDRCVFYIGGFNNRVTEWSIPNMASTDFFDACSESENTGLKNYNGYQKPKTGNAYAGIYAYTDKNYREYVQGKLLTPLTRGRRYKMTFYLSLADKSSYALKDIQVLMTEERLKPCYKSNGCKKVIQPSKVTKKQFKMYSKAEDIYFSSKEQWMKYSFEFIAQGYENYFSIGNFYKNPRTQKQKVLSTSTLFFSYYYIDEVSLKSMEAEDVEAIEEVITEPEIKTDRVYTFKNVLFNFDKAELLEDSIDELNELYQYLNEHPSLNIEIYGHTDSEGLDKRNKELSEERAKAVVDYLISRGLDLKRIKFFGYGSSKPIKSNNSEAGRQLNRRVEFKLIEN
ncbi:OmpA family protein [uncultured Winogradskyella sp.]|uniref:OmpA family protein n=1 Tax=uncultured Winogradskyella sp. TaxID=395353 RepID=UPI0026211BB0|nr:OmpA family protein [uncultured Winogradskyella sp.]